MDGTVLVADDDRTIRTVLTQALTRAGCRVRATGNTATLWRWVEEGEGDAVVSDVMMPDGNGLDLLPAIRKRRPNLPVVVISARNTFVTAVHASEAGAFDYVPKPFDLRELLGKVSRALTQNMQPVSLAAAPPAPASALPLIGGSPAMQQVYRVMARVLHTDLNVLVHGESGTGKDLLARILHDFGRRSRAAFLRIPCGTIGTHDLSDILESPDASDATIYLDELGDMSVAVQLHLLGLTERPEARHKPPRLVSSTSQSLAHLVNEAGFRKDLFHRLNVIPIALPPLRDRPDDIPDLARHFLVRAERDGLPQKTFACAALEQMRLAPWPGNLRGLSNFVQRVAVLCPEDEIGGSFVAKELKQIVETESPTSPIVSDSLSASVGAHIRCYLDLHGDQLPPPGLYNRILREVEKPLIALSLSATRGNQIRTAELLGINRNTLRKKIRELDIQVTRSRKMM
ncbi:MAG: response regulator [Rhodobacteraceae bacterium]|nr:response regulator [Paracoccaceae bacterium]